MPPRIVTSLFDNIESAILGKREVVHLLLTALLANGHILLEDVPGVGKTTLARALAKSVDGAFQRIQFTPDLLPSDILGVSIFHAESHEFQFKPGPIFANVILADEVNRTTPRTQSALLEAMMEGTVSVDGATRALPEPFMVIATQNPIEYAGTYPLPESQLDRFLLRVRIGYPSPADERRVLYAQQTASPIDSLQPVASGEQIRELQAQVRNVAVDESLADYLLEIANRSRTHDRLIAGVSPRGSLALFRAAQARAFIEGRDFVIPDDIKALAVPVLAHRIVEKASFDRGTSQSGEGIIEQILADVPVPV